MPPLRRMPPLALERLDASAAQLLRHARALEPADGAEHDARPDGAACARHGRDVLEYDVVRLRARVPHRAYDFRAEARVRAQAALRPERLCVRAYLALRGVVRLPVRVQRAGEGVPVSRDVGCAALCLVVDVGWANGWERRARTGYVLSFLVRDACEGEDI